MSIASPAEDVNVNVRRALRAQLLTVDGLPPESAFQWEGVTDFTPPTDGSCWIRETMLRPPSPEGGSDRASIGTEARVRNRGGYQISLFYPPDGNQDVYDIEAMAGRIRKAFPFSLQLTYGGQLVTCEGAQVGTSSIVTQLGKRYLFCQIRIPWWADTFNPI